MFQQHRQISETRFRTVSTPYSHTPPSPQPNAESWQNPASVVYLFGFGASARLEMVCWWWARFADLLDEKRMSRAGRRAMYEHILRRILPEWISPKWCFAIFQKKPTIQSGCPRHSPADPKMPKSRLLCSRPCYVMIVSCY